MPKRIASRLIAVFVFAVLSLGSIVLTPTSAAQPLIHHAVVAQAVAPVPTPLIEHPGDWFRAVTRHPVAPPVVSSQPPDFPGTTIPDLVTPQERTGWYHVNLCEEGGRWNVVGSEYSGGLGIKNSNWVAYGGERDFGPAYAASPDEQITVAIRINGPAIPDQGGCAGW